VEAAQNRQEDKHRQIEQVLQRTHGVIAAVVLVRMKSLMTKSLRL
jgi:hypothetical protein